jgi:hypothetical protein
MKQACYLDELRLQRIKYDCLLQFRDTSKYNVNNRRILFFNVYMNNSCFSNTIQAIPPSYMAYQWFICSLFNDAFSVTQTI